MEITDSLFLSLNNETGALPSAIELVPAGDVISGRDGRKWKKSDSQKIVKNSMSRLSRLVIDENHATDLAAPKGGSSPAMGWMTNLRTGEDGSIWADVEWTARGKAAVLNKEYSFISPVFLHDDQGEITVVLRAGLTNSPNLQLPAINAEAPEKIMTEVFMSKELLTALGLGENATEEEVLAAVKALVAVAAAAKAAAKEDVAMQASTTSVDLLAYSPRADLNAMETRALAAEKQLASLNAERLKKDAEAAVDEAIKARKIAPSSREEYLAVCSTAEGLEKMKNIFSKSPAIISTEPCAPEGVPPASGSGVSLNADESAAAKAMGYTAEEFQKLKEKKP
jgi:phage I-like protein